MGKIKRHYKLWILLAMLCTLTGCSEREELEDNAYVIGLGIDSSEEGGFINVTMLIANPEVGSMQGGGGSTEKPRETISFDAIDLITAKATANAIISRDISYELLKVVVVSEEFARKEAFIPVIYDVQKDKEIRMDSYLVISKEKAFKYLQNNKPRMETRPHKYFQFMIQHGIDNGLIPESTLFSFFTAIDRGTDFYLAMYTTTKKEKNPSFKEEDSYLAGQVKASGEHDNTQFIGSAVFNNGIMVDTLNGKDTRMINILDDNMDMKDVLVNIPDPFSDKGQQLAVRILKPQNNTIKMNLKTPIPKIIITIPLNIEVMTNPSLVNYAQDPKKQQILKKYIEENIAASFNEFLERTQTELKGSPFPLSIHARKYFKTIQEFEHFNWVQSYPKAQITVKPDIEIIDYGTQKKALKK